MLNRRSLFSMFGAGAAAVPLAPVFAVAKPQDKRSADPVSASVIASAQDALQKVSRENSAVAVCKPELMTRKDGSLGYKDVESYLPNGAVIAFEQERLHIGQFIKRARYVRALKDYNEEYAFYPAFIAMWRMIAADYWAATMETNTTRIFSAYTSVHEWFQQDIVIDIKDARTGLLFSLDFGTRNGKKDGEKLVRVMASWGIVSGGELWAIAQADRYVTERFG